MPVFTKSTYRAKIWRKPTTYRRKQSLLCIRSSDRCPSACRHHCGPKVPILKSNAHRAVRLAVSPSLGYSRLGSLSYTLHVGERFHLNARMISQPTARAAFFYTTPRCEDRWRVRATAGLESLASRKILGPFLGVTTLRGVYGMRMRFMLDRRGCHG